MTDDQRAEQFVRQILTAANYSSVSRTTIAAALFEAAGALARQDVIEDATRRNFYAEALKTLADHVLGPLAAPKVSTH